MAATTGSVTVGASAVQLNATSTPFLHQVSIKAAHANTGQVYIGFASNVTAGTAAATDGYELNANETLVLGVGLASDLNQIYAIASAASQKVFLLWE